MEYWVDLRCFGFHYSIAPAAGRALPTQLLTFYLVLLKRQEAYILLPKVSWQYEHS